MGCILRVNGKKFDVDRFMAKTTLKPFDVFYADDRVPWGPQKGRKLGVNGMWIDASRINRFGPRQFEEVTRFLKKNAKELARLRRTKGIDLFVLDFLTEYRYNLGLQYFTLPPALMKEAGKLGLSITLAVFRGSEKEV